MDPEAPRTNDEEAGVCRICLDALSARDHEAGDAVYLGCRWVRYPLHSVLYVWVAGEEGG